MCASMEKRAAINVPENMALICNACNMEMTAEKEVIIRRVKCMQVGTNEVLSLDGLRGLYSDDMLIRLGAALVQMWLDSMEMKTRYDARSMAGL